MKTLPIQEDRSASIAIVPLFSSCGSSTAEYPEAIPQLVMSTTGPAAARNCLHRGASALPSSIPIKISARVSFDPI